MTVPGGTWIGALHGLRVRSDWPLPGLWPAPVAGPRSRADRRGDQSSTVARCGAAAPFRRQTGDLSARVLGGAPADVRITAGPVPSGLTLPVYRRVAAEATADELLLHLPDVGRVWVRDGRTITVAWDGPPRPAALAATLEAAVWSAVLQQRGRLVLRGAAVDLGTGAVLLVGPSGSGTSTLAAALAVHHDAVVLADTVVPVGVVDGRPVIWIGPPGVELWPRSAAALGLPVGPHATVAGSVARVALGRRLAEPTETRAVTTMCVLDANHRHSTAATLLPVTGTDRFVAVSEAELRPERAAVFTGGRVARFDVAATLAAAATLWQVRRRWYPWSVESVAAIVAAAAR